MKIWEKLFELGKEVKHIEKDATVKGTKFSYDYVSGGAIQSKIDGKMKELKLMLYPTLEGISVQLEGSARIVTASMFMQWVDTETGEIISVPWGMTGENSEASKALGSGLTYSHRYFLLKFFNINTDEDDADAKNGVVTKKKVENPHLPAIKKSSEKAIAEGLLSQIIDFGKKHKGKTWGEVEKGYVEWLAEQEDSPRVRIAKQVLDLRADEVSEENTE